MFNYNICSDCEVNNGCNVTCSTGNFAAMLSLSRAPSKQTRSHKGNYDPSNAAVSHCNISGVSLWLLVSQPHRELSPVGRVGQYGCYGVGGPRWHAYSAPGLLI